MLSSLESPDPLLGLEYKDFLIFVLCRGSSSLSAPESDCLGDLFGRAVLHLIDRLRLPYEGHGYRAMVYGGKHIRYKLTYMPRTLWP
jgi:hypothetical protein